MGTLTLNRPEIHNAFDDQMIQELIEVFENQASHPDLRILVITGAGKSFSAGGDLNWMKRQKQASFEDNKLDAQQLGKMLQLLNDFPKPTIAMINGATFAGALGLVSCCDIALAVEQAKFCVSEVKLGLVPSMIAPYVMKKIGYSNARHLFLSAEIFQAQKAYEIGLVHKVCLPEELESITDELCQQMIANGPEALENAKSLIEFLAQSQTAETILDKTSQIIAERRASDEGQEGMSAFFEKRAANWSK